MLRHSAGYHTISIIAAAVLSTAASYTTAAGCFRQLTVLLPNSWMTALSLHQYHTVWLLLKTV